MLRLSVSCLAPAAAKATAAAAMTMCGLRQKMVSSYLLCSSSCFLTSFMSSSPTTAGQIGACLCHWQPLLASPGDAEHPDMY
jgi:hypothetical protein